MFKAFIYARKKYLVLTTQIFRKLTPQRWHYFEILGSESQKNVTRNMSYIFRSIYGPYTTHDRLCAAFQGTCT
jgi:hypothetical protein